MIMSCDRGPSTRSVPSSHTNISRHAAPATLGSSARRRGGDAARQRAAITTRRRGRRCGERALGGVDGAVDVRAREREQHVARLLDEQHREDVQDEERERRRRRDDQPVDPGLQPPAGDEREHQRDEERRPDVLHLAGRLRDARVDLLEQQRESRPKPVAVISGPLRLSGRRCQATRPNAANEPPTRR